MIPHFLLHEMNKMFQKFNQVRNNIYIFEIDALHDNDDDDEVH